MNGSTRPGDRATRDLLSQHDAPPAATAMTDVARKSTFSLPSLRGGGDANARCPPSQPVRPTPAAVTWSEPERSRSGNLGAPRNPQETRKSHHSPHSRQPYEARHYQSHYNSPSTLSGSQDTQESPMPSETESGARTKSASTPPATASDGGTNGEGRNSHASSQDSQLLQLSQLAAAREKLPAEADTITSPLSTSLKRKRIGPEGGQVSGRERLSTSPVFPGAVGGTHSRNASVISVASTSGSRMGELSHELRTRLSYAMVKVNNGWESHSIDEVESLASRAASPSSTASTLHGRHGSSVSPQLVGTDNRSPTRRVPRGPGSDRHQQSYYHISHMGGHNSKTTASSGNTAMSPPPLLKPAPSLAPAVSIKPSSLSSTNPRRNSNPAFSPAFLSHGYVSASPRTPAEAVSTRGTPRQAMARTPMADPIIFSPHQNVREQDAIESLLFMSSPGNSANLKHSYPSSSSQPVVSTRTGAVAPGHRTALPGGQPRKSLPSSRGQASQPAKRVGFEASSSTFGDMDVDTPSLTMRSAQRPRVNGGSNIEFPRPRIPVTIPAGLGATLKPRRPTLTEEDIDKMLDRCVDENSSDSDEEEIQIPVHAPGVGIVRS